MPSDVSRLAEAVAIALRADPELVAEPAGIGRDALHQVADAALQNWPPVRQPPLP